VNDFENVSSLAYPRGGLMADGARAAIGLLLTAPPLLFVDMLWPIALVFAALAIVFACFGARTLCRALSRYALNETALAASGCHRGEIRWDALTALRLRHFRPRRKPADGWIEMRLAAGRQKMLIESKLDGFDAIARAAVVAARKRGLTLDTRSEDALVSLGLTDGLKTAAGRWEWAAIENPKA
jgi:hypothetical protein